MPRWLVRALDKGAEARVTDRSDYVRQAVLDRLERDQIKARPESER